MTKKASKQLAVLGIALLLVAIDQLSKMLVEASLEPRESIEVLGEWLRFTLVYNDSAAFSIGVGATWPLTVISSIAVLLIIWYGPRSKTTTWLVISGLVLGGATGNLIDRLFREPSFANGHVVDFLQIPFNFPIFNLADVFVVTGVSLAMLRTLRGDEIGGERK